MLTTPFYASLLLSLACIGLGAFAGCTDAAQVPRPLDAAVPATGSDAAPPALDASSSPSTECKVPPASTLHEPPTRRPFELHTVDVVAHPEAVCNDGSPAVYAVRPGSGTDKSRWLVDLDGGGACTEYASCKARFDSDHKRPGGPQNTGSGGYTASWLAAETWGGVLSDNEQENPLFHDATQVIAFYCSSDVWAGDLGAVEEAAGEDTRQWHFRGRAILRAVVEELLPAGLGRATEVVLNGTSAGGYGVYHNADDVRAMLPSDTRYVAIADAGFFIDHPAWDPATKAASTATPTYLTGLLASASVMWGGRGDASCEAVIGHARCYRPDEMVKGGFIDTPLLIQQSQLDNNQLVRFGTRVDPETGKATTADEQVYVDGFAARMRTLLEAADSRHAVFARANAFHVATIVPPPKSTAFVSAKIGATTLSDFIAMWYADPCRGPRLIEQL